MRPSPLVPGIGAGLVMLLVTAPLTGDALGDLAGARERRAQIAREATAPAQAIPIVEKASRLDAPDAAAARAMMMARIQRLARAGGVLVEETSAAEAPDGLAALRIRVSGAEKAVVALADAFEREQPLMRLRSWRIEPVAGGVRLTGDAVAVQ
ncbi:hypothetical protein FHS95_002463 [Sphingomonas naasensis]|uniref:Type II secretion system protein M n=1 Tax=Sphingomonas naasensis TaxID=1344951 RepID=A0A4S1WJ85_9SPHN|nr:hypothetical protein [Sphingomonas naasensis]NIJ20771.1 hypothetical protein [Sphingomonas naasensis]TGX43179.1 hypothetical protein E5A74_08365 [Sphingomonas naasensis]